MTAKIKPKAKAPQKPETVIQNCTFHVGPKDGADIVAIANAIKENAIAAQKLAEKMHGDNYTGAAGLRIETSQD